MVVACFASYAHLAMYTCEHANQHAKIFPSYTYPCIYTHKLKHYANICLLQYVCMPVLCVYVCIYIYTYIHKFYSTYGIGIYEYVQIFIHAFINVYVVYVFD